MKQYYRCQGWGHTQTACGKQERCGECAGSHLTKDYRKEKVSCVNCGKAHKAWQRRCYNTFQAFLDDMKRKRINLVKRTQAARNVINTQPTPPTQTRFQLLTKRPRTQNTPEPSQEEKRGKGQPTNIELAAREPGQS